MLALFASHSRPLLTLFIQSGIIAQGIVLPTLRVALPILVKSFWKLIDMPVVYLHGDIKASQIVMKMDHPSYDCSTRRLRQKDYERLAWAIRWDLISKKTDKSMKQNTTTIAATAASSNSNNK